MHLFYAQVLPIIFLRNENYSIFESSGHKIISNSIFSVSKDISDRNERLTPTISNYNINLLSSLFRCGLKCPINISIRITSCNSYHKLRVNNTKILKFLFMKWFRLWILNINTSFRLQNIFFVINPTYLSTQKYLINIVTKIIISYFRCCIVICSQSRKIKNFIITS